MKIDDLLEAGKSKKGDSWVKKADDWMRGTFAQQQINKAQTQSGRKGPASTASAVKTKSAPKKKAQFKSDKINPGKIPNSAQYKDAAGVMYTWNQPKSAWLPNDKKQTPLDAKRGAVQYNQANRNDRGFYESAVSTGQVLKEGGNIFKTEPDKKLMVQRIATPDVHPTIQFIEKITGLVFDEEDWLGTTGKKQHADGSVEKNSSGDLDLNTDENKVSKQELIATLTAWCKKQGIADADIMNKGRTKQDGWIQLAGAQVHFRTPIKGDAKNGFVQTDFMFSLNPDFQRGAKRGGTEQFGGMDRAILLSSLARGRGYKFSPVLGVVDPNNGDQVVTNDWSKGIPELLLGKGAKEADTHTVESMLAYLKKDPNYEELIAPWKETMAKAGKEVPESSNEIIDMAHRMSR